MTSRFKEMLDNAPMAKRGLYSLFEVVPVLRYHITSLIAAAHVRKMSFVRRLLIQGLNLMVGV